MKLILGDCLEEMKKLPDKSVDLVVTDPPYKVIGGGANHPTINMKGSVVGKNDGKIFKHNDIEISEWLPEVKRVMKDDTQGYIFTNQLNLLPYLKEIEKQGLEVHRVLIWDKGIATWTRWYMKSYEPIIFFRKGKAKAINEQGTKDIISVANPREKIHPTEKPTNLISVLIRNSSNGDDVVFDPFMGSGTTGCACKELGRDFIGIELNEEYYDIAQNRINQTMGSLF